MPSPSGAGQDDGVAPKAPRLVRVQEWAQHPPSLAAGLPFQLLGGRPEGQLLATYGGRQRVPEGWVGPQRRAPRCLATGVRGGAEGHTLTESHKGGGEDFARLRCGVKLLLWTRELTERHVGPCGRKVHPSDVINTREGGEGL